MPAWALKLAAIFVTVFTLAGSFGYASAHVKNANAPLQPPVADKPAVASVPATATPVPTIGPLITLRPGQKAPTVTPGPRLTLAPAVKSATLAPLTFTHTS
jgi:hypothetical protein